MLGTIVDEQSLAYCKKLAQTHYENFPVATRFLPKSIRPHLYTVYAYCRTVDDLGDEALGDRLTLLSEWEADFMRCYRGRPDHPVLKALQWTIRTHDIPPEPFLKLIEANRRDQLIHGYDTYDDLLDYCDYSANPVGHLFLYLFGYSDERRQSLSDATCTALQLTNFWQDIAEDYERDRIYIPREDLERFDYTENDLANRIVNDKFRALMAVEVDRARNLFFEGDQLPALLDNRLRIDVKLFSESGKAILEAIRNAGYDVFHRRPMLSTWRKLGLLFTAALRDGLGYSWALLGRK